MTTQQIDYLRQLLVSISDYMAERSDADHNGENFVPNEEMKIKGETEKFINILDNEHKTTDN